MNSEVEILDMIEVRRFLREGDLYDATLSEQEMQQLYKAVKDSQTTATQEDEHRKIIEQTEVNCSVIEELQSNSATDIEEEPHETSIEQAADAFEDLVCSSSKENGKIETKEKPFAPKTWVNQKKQVKGLSEVDDQVSSTSAPVKDRTATHLEEEEEDINVTEDVVDLFNSVPTAHKPLHLIHRVSQYSPPPYCNPKYAHLDTHERARLIANYHLELLAKYNAYQRQSLIPAPWGKPIQASANFNGNLMKNCGKSDETVDSSQEELNEIAREDSDKDYEIYVSKSGRQTKRKLYTENFTGGKKKSKSSLADEEHGNNNDGDWKRRSGRANLKDGESGKKTPAKKPRIESLSNEVIMNQSKLFNDKLNSSRSDILFDKLKEQNLKTKETEETIEKFKNTLDSDSEDEFIIDSSAVTALVHSEESHIRRRIPPPSGVRKPAGKNAERGKSKRSTANKKSDNSSQESLSLKYDPLDCAVPMGSSRKKGTCPVCYEQFFQSELEEHAAACLDTISQTSKPTEVGLNQISCEKCDQVFPLTMAYEEHVIECLKN